MVKVLLLIAVLYCVFAPPRWDLAIRWKEANMRWAERLRKEKQERKNAKEG